MKISCLAVLRIAFLLAIFVSFAIGQETTGSIEGVITDTTNAVITGATVTVTNTSTNQSVTMESQTNGRYRVTNLIPGRYQVKMVVTGFRTQEYEDVIVLVGKTSIVNGTMEVGQVEEVVQVTETAALIDTNTAMVAHNVTFEEFDRLPKPRSFQGLAVLSPSVNTGEIEGGFQVNGASAAENNYYVDGVSTTSLLDGRARQNAVFEFLQEVQVKTNGLEAEYGGALGGVVSAITKSGGNDWHGELHYYFYGNRIGAGPTQRMQLDPVTETAFKYIQDDKNKRDNHEIGGSLGGPIVPNRMFFFLSASPRWQRASYDYLFGNGTEPGTMTRDAHQMNLFSKLSLVAHERLRMNFSWLYTPQYTTGSLPAFDGYEPNVAVRSLESAMGSRTRGYRQPEQSYSGQVDYMLSPTSLLSVRGGRYYLNFKEIGIPFRSSYWWQASSVGIEGVPADLQQPFNFTTPSAAQIQFDLTTRTYVSADFSQFFNFGGTHNLKAGVGTQKNVNRVNDSWYGPDGRVRLYWDLEFRGDRGQYGYYLVEDGATRGSTGANITHLYLQDQWRIFSRLTINAGVRLEKETIPSFRRDVQDKAISFGFGDKVAPRLGASYDVLGNGRLKISGAWGRFYDWTKYDLSRGTFGGDVWNIYYRSLDTLDIYSINLDNLPGRNLWTTGPYRDLRVPGFEYLDPDVKPMSSYQMNFGVEYEILPQTVFTARYSRNHLIRTIEDMGALDEAGNEVYRYGNPGEGTNTIAPVSGATCVVELPSGACGFNMPKAKRDYNAMELTLTKRFGSSWLANVSYVYSRLYGNYAGLQSTDEIRPPTLGYGFGANQVFGAENFRPGGNANRYFDLDEAFFDAHGNLGLEGRLPTDRPHVFKLYGAKDFRGGFTVGGFFRAMSGTPVTTQVTTVNHIPFYVEGRGDMGRTPFFNQTDLMVAKEFRVGETKRLRFEFNLDNVFNQKTSMFTFDRYNREEHPDSAGIDLSETDLSQGFDWQTMVAETTDGVAGKARDPRFGQAAIFNTGFQGRFLVKFTF